MHSQNNCALNSLDSNTWWIYNEITHLKPIFPKWHTGSLTMGFFPLIVSGDHAECEGHCKRLSKDRNVLVDQNSSSRTAHHRTPISALKNTNFSATGMETFSFLIWSGSDENLKNKMKSFLTFFFPVGSRATVTVLAAAESSKLWRTTEPLAPVQEPDCEAQTLQLKTSQQSLGAGLVLRPHTCRAGLPHTRVTCHLVTPTLERFLPGWSGCYRESKLERQRR